MKRLAIPIALLVVVAGGCVKSSLGGYGKYIEQEIRFKGVVQGLTALRKAGEIDDDAFKLIDPFVQEGNQILKDIHAQIDATPPGETPQVSVNLTDRLLSITDKLLTEYERRKS
jgi:hypothetical protein